MRWNPRGKRVSDKELKKIRADILDEAESYRASGHWERYRQRLVEAEEVFKQISKKGREKIEKDEKDAARFIYDVDQLAEEMSLPEWDKIEENNNDYFWETAKFSMENEGIGEDDPGFEDKMMEFETEARDELYFEWKAAVIHAAEQALEEVGLTLEPWTAHLDEKQKPVFYQFRVWPDVDHQEAYSWDDDNLLAAWFAIGQRIRDIGASYDFDIFTDAIEEGRTIKARDVADYVIGDIGVVWSNIDVKRIYERALR